MRHHDIVVIGGSSGATAPLKAILRDLPADLPAAILVVLHLPAFGHGILATAASAAGPLQVHAAEDGMRIEPGHVYLAVPDHHLLLSDNHLRLGDGPRENLARPAIDALFRSAAIARGPSVIGVLLSGMLADGAAGLRAIKQCGGLAVVQDPADAAAPAMPLAGLQAAPADHSLTAARLGAVLADLVREPAGPAVPVPDDLEIEVAIAAGNREGSAVMRTLADPVPLTCPECGGVLSQINGGPPLRFRCQIGHAYTAETLASEQQPKVDAALGVALRIVEERAELVSRMARDNRDAGRPAVADMYEARAAEYRHHARTLRRAMSPMAPPIASAMSRDTS